MYQSHGSSSDHENLWGRQERQINQIGTERLLQVTGKPGSRRSNLQGRLLPRRPSRASRLCFRIRSPPNCFRSNWRRQHSEEAGGNAMNRNSEVVGVLVRTWAAAQRRRYSCPSPFLATRSCYSEGFWAESLISSTSALIHRSVAEMQRWNRTYAWAGSVPTGTLTFLQRLDLVSPLHCWAGGFRTELWIC
jgi:hypothetical protein